MQTRVKRLLTVAVVSAALLGVWQVSLTSADESPPPLEPGSITVHKFADANGNGDQDEGEEDIEGWLMRLYQQVDGSLQKIAEGTTGPDGTVTFGDLPPGTYKVWEKLPECWEPTRPGNRWNGGLLVRVDLSEGQEAGVTFGNRDTCATPPTPPPPAESCIDLEKTGPDTAAPGETITYHFWLKNCGDVALVGGAQVYDSLFGDAPIWSGDLDPGEIVEFDRAYTLPDDCGEFTNTAWAVGHPPGLPDVTDQDGWTLVVVCEPEPAPSIDVEKFVSANGENWYDADTPAEALEVAVGSDVYFKFWVKNSGNVELTTITLHDSHYDVSGCALTDPLPPDAFFECVIGPFEAMEGWHVNTATASGDHGGATYTDIDRAKYHGYVGPAPAFGFEKYVNGQDADTLAEAVEVDVGDTLTFSYTVTNEGNVPIEWTGLTDDVFGDLGAECALPRTIEVGQSDFCEITRPAGDYPQGTQNIGTASVTDLADQTDPAWYITEEEEEEWDRSSLHFEAGCEGDCEEITATVCNGADSEDMDGPSIWELYWAASGNPKNGVVIASGTIDPLAAGECQVLTYDPGDNSNGASGNYMFKAYQRPGHPGTTELWSEACELACEACPDADGDGVCDGDDGCPDDPDKTEPGACGCGVPDTDADGDGTPDCIDGCPDDPDKTEPGACGCGVPDTDADGDGTPDCIDGCPDDPDKTEPGLCGCGVPDTDCEVEWDRSSLHFDGDCEGDCDEIAATVCNGADSEDMDGPSIWELYWAASGNPKNGVVIASGTIDPLAAGECQVLTYDPGDNSNGASGNYMFKAYQRPGHPGTTELWSEACELACEAVAGFLADGAPLAARPSRPVAQGATAGVSIISVLVGAAWVLGRQRLL
jgi:YqxM protein